MIPDPLRARVDEFLSTLRIGIDFGETAGGIALVHGNKILHAETFVDFHEATLEDRRKMRRGRRTRHSKKMRIARLRSWILRQRLPDGTRLPDPYMIMDNPKFQTKPGLYRTSGANPKEIPTWIEAAKEGKVDSDGFVCALTHIFQKRGYKYDDKELDELSASALENFLNSCCLLKEAGELNDKIHSLVKAYNKPGLTHAYENALNRMVEPHKAQPRIIKEQELKIIVEKFGKSNGLSNEIVLRWQHNLVGLLNRVVRQARFDNRTKSGCSWCGKNTPRLKPKVRELAYKAAIGNLRVYDRVSGGSPRKLNTFEMAGFMKLWQHRQSESYKFSRSSKSDLFDRAPTKENIKRLFDQLNVVKSWIKNSKGKPIYDYAMLSQIDNLINKKAKVGRARLCMEHLAMAADGKSMYDAGLAWQIKRSRHAANPCLEQHDARIIRRIEHMLFINGKTGDDAWQWYLRDSVSGKPFRLGFITLEVPTPETQQSSKGQVPKRNDKKLKELLLEETGGVCIYQYTRACIDRKGNLSLETAEKDHIVPQNSRRGGPDIRINLVACCKECNHPNTGKGSRLPSEWIKYNSPDWELFKARVNSLPGIPDAKKHLLLLPPGSSFPDDPTPLARTGARPNAFAQELITMFKKYGILAPSIEYVVGRPHIQQINGRWTTKFRQAWLWKDFDAKIGNFPPKDRRDLLNHAQDAALVAATPPHTWREQIFVETALRWCIKRDALGQPIRQDGKIVMELRPRPGLPILELAPDWATYAKENKRVPVIIWDRHINWHHRLMDQTFYQKPKNLNGKLKVHKPVDNFDARLKPGQRRYTSTPNIGGLLVQVPYINPITKKVEKRKVQIKPISSIAVIIWIDTKGHIGLSRVHPNSIRKFVKSTLDVPIPEGAKQIKRINRGEVLYLQEKGPYPAGFYRVKELGKTNITVIPENSINADIAKKLGIPEEEVSVIERKLGKLELREIFHLNMKKSD